MNLNAHRYLFASAINNPKYPKRPSKGLSYHADLMNVKEESQGKHNYFVKLLECQTRVKFYFPVHSTSGKAFTENAVHVVNYVTQHSDMVCTTPKV